jgi:uncharacterized protein (DUF1778 family)
MKKRGRPKTGRSDLKAGYLDLRVSSDEKTAFKNAAAIAGIPLSMWVRERLRRAARRELEEAGQQVPFVPNFPVG